jgi:hypothetical protein
VTEIEVGYHVRAVLQGRGLATEAAAASRDYAHQVLKVDRLVAIMDARSRPSRRVAEKLGLVFERDSDNHAAGAIRSASMPLPEAAPTADGNGVGMGDPASGSKSTPGGPANAPC